MVYVVLLVCLNVVGFFRFEKVVYGEVGLCLDGLLDKLVLMIEVCGVEWC